MTDPVHIGEAYLRVAMINYYLVCVDTRNITDEELSTAEERLIEYDLSLDSKDDVANRALDLIQQEIRRRLRA